MKEIKLFLARVKKTVTATTSAWSRRLGGGSLRDLPVLNINLQGPLEAPRLNLVILALRRKARFGGTDTAIRFFLKLAERFSSVRIVVLSESARDFEPDDWKGWVVDPAEGLSAKTIVFLGGKTSPLVISESDYFLATHWLTAYYVRLVKTAMAQSKSKVSRSIYFIQDFEPGFYAWSGRYLLAESTYHLDETVTAVFNTGLLADFFDRNGYKFDSHFAFEPKLSPGLRSMRNTAQSSEKERVLLVYGRPGVARNAFDLAVAALKEWAVTFPGAIEWSVISLGERHEAIRLAPGVIMRSEGKVSLDTYGTYLRKASVGLSLMVSPHPSYPPLEMAEFGVRVVTNNFDNKDLSHHSPLITGVGAADPKSLAKALSECCDDFERLGPGGRVDTSFGTPGEEFPFVEELVSEVLAS